MNSHRVPKYFLLARRSEGEGRIVRRESSVRNKKNQTLLNCYLIQGNVHFVDEGISV